MLLNLTYNNIMVKNSEHKQDVVIIGGGTSGMMCALGAIQAKLRVTLVCNNTDFLSSSLLRETIPSKAFIYCSTIAQQIRQAKIFGLDPQLGAVNLNKVNLYIKAVVSRLQPDNDLDLFEKLGGTLLVGDAKFINSRSVIVNNIKINSKYFIIATGIREHANNILDLTRKDFITYKQLFNLTSLPKRTIILAKNPESLEIAQALCRFGSKVTLVFPNKNILPVEDIYFTKKLLSTLAEQQIKVYFSSKILQFLWQNKRKLLICQNNKGDKFAIDSDEIIDMQNYQPNVERLALSNANVQYNFNGILVNNKLQTTQKNIFAVGSVVDSVFRSVHLIEHQVNIALSNIAFKIPRSINYQLIPRIIDTYPQFASIGTTQIAKHPEQDHQIKILKFKFKDLDAAIYQNQLEGEIKLVCNDNKLLGVSIFGPNANELINEYSLAMHVGSGVSDIANSIHTYPSLSQINKRVAHLIFSTNNTSRHLAIGRAIYKMSQVFGKLSFVN